MKILTMIINDFKLLLTTMPSSLRERSFLILGSGAEDVWLGDENVFHYFEEVRKFSEQFLWSKELPFLKRFWIKMPAFENNRDIKKSPKHIYIRVP